MKQNFQFTLLLLALTAFLNTSRGQNVLDNKIYRVTAYKSNTNNITSTSNYAEVIPPLSVFIPDAFTPNGDGINDTFGVKGEGIQNFMIRIFDRWGELVFESNNPKRQWDGYFRGKPAQTDTYVYQVLASGFGSRTKTGSVTLIR